MTAATTRRPAAPHRWRRAAVLVPAAVLVVAAALRIPGLGSPDRAYSDELYYAVDANAYVTGQQPDYGKETPPPEGVTTLPELSWSHPPLGKLVISTGIQTLGARPVAWRLPAVAFGLIGVGLAYAIALLLWRSPWWAGLAGLLVATDGLHVTQSRLAMLDVFLSTFVLAGALCLVMEHRRTNADTATRQRPRPRRRPPSAVERVFGSPWRLGAGIAFGAAVTTKWSGIYALLPAAALCTWWALRSGPGDRRARLVDLGRVALAFAVVPIAVYVVSYFQWFLDNGPDVGAWFDLQRAMLAHSTRFGNVQPQSSRPWQWPLLLRVFRYEPGFKPLGPLTNPEVLGLGNPVLWWGWVALLPATLWGVVRRREWATTFFFVAYLCLYVPWFFFGRTSYSFYMTPAVPFMALGVVAAVRLLEPGLRRWLAPALAVGAVALAALFFPVWLNLKVPEAWAQAIHWLPKWY